MPAQTRLRPATGALSSALATAPSSPGVYLFLDRRRALLYVGKAKDLRSRLRQHASARGSLYRRIAAVRWQQLPDEDAAAAREADLIVALQPPYNASIAGEGMWTYIHVTTLEKKNRVRFALSAEQEGDSDRIYGCFPHLGAGVSSVPGIACSDGYAAFLRLLWTASGEGTHYPGRITRGTPPESFDVTVDPNDTPALHAFLSGTSRRLLPPLAVAARRRDPYMHGGIARDYALAERFFKHGPKALRTLRLRHGLAPAPVPATVIEDLLSDEVAELIRDA
jgi:GIY-YIG catalytic domain